MKWTLLFNFSLLVVCFIHVITILFNFLNPENPNVKYYEMDLKDIEFPLTFKICYERDDQLEIFQNLGYDRIYYDFYKGRSMYNSSLYGWNGHTKNETTIIPVESKGKVKKLIEFSIKGLTNPSTTPLIENHGRWWHRLMAVVCGSSGWVGSDGC